LHESASEAGQKQRKKSDKNQKEQWRKGQIPELNGVHWEAR
jgi:hypothetical protein